MSLQPFAIMMLGSILLGSSTCAPHVRNPIKMKIRRIAELDRLEQQAGMPDTYPSRGLKEARAHLSARHRAAAEHAANRAQPPQLARFSVERSQ